jgi:hypothetical protein
VRRPLKKNSEPHTGARPSVRLCVGPELARCVHRIITLGIKFSNSHGLGHR